MAIFAALKVDTGDVTTWLECDSDLSTCQDLSDENIVQDVTQTANEVHMLSDECSSCSPDSQNVAETDFDSTSAPTDQEAADAFTTCMSITGTQMLTLFVR